MLMGLKRYRSEKRGFWRMYTIIHRGTGQIGGSVIEIGTAQTRLIFDAGTNLPPIDDKTVPDDFQLEGLTFGMPAFHGIFISHHHGDHCGLLERVLTDIPVYTGSLTEKILTTIADFTGQKRPHVHGHFIAGQEILVGDIRVTPIPVEHSARDSYMFLVQAEGRNVLYTGDFRNAEPPAGQVLELLNGEPLHLLISEGTNIRDERRGSEASIRDERDVARDALKLMKEYDGTVFVLCSSTNEMRIRAITRAAVHAKRLFYEDYFQASVRGREDEQVYHFVPWRVTEDSPKYPYFQQFCEQKKLVGAKRLAGWSRKKVIFVRASMRDFVDRYLTARRENPEFQEGERNLLIYSMWSGYRRSGYTKAFLDFCEERGMDIVSLHCSGHAYHDTIQSLIEGLHPLALLPVHCEADDRPLFRELHPNCVLYGDGKRWEVP